MITSLFAQQSNAPTTSTPPVAGGILEMIMPLALMFLVFYFLLIRPQKKKTKEHQALLKNLKKDDEIVTASGMYGTVSGLTDTIVTLEIANNVRVKVDRHQIARVVKGV